MSVPSELSLFPDLPRDFPHYNEPCGDCFPHRLHEHAATPDNGGKLTCLVPRCFCQEFHRI